MWNEILSDQDQFPSASQHSISSYEEATSYQALLISSLHEPYRTVLTLSHIYHWSVPSIAHHLHRPLGTIKGQLSRGQHLLKNAHQHVSSSPTLSSLSSPEIHSVPSPLSLQQQVSHLRQQQVSYATIAKRLHITPGYARVLSHRAQQASWHPSCTPSVPDKHAGSHRRRALPTHHRHQIHQIPTRWRQAVELAYLHHLSNHQIATALHCPINTVKVYLKRGLDFLLEAQPSSSP